MLKRDEVSERYGIRLPSDDGGTLLALKVANLRLLPFDDVVMGSTVDNLLYLPADILECLLRYLSARSLLRLSATCAFLRSILAANEKTIWKPLLAHPLFEPYQLSDNKAFVGLPPWSESCELRSTVAQGNKWHSEAQRGGHCFIFERFVRAIAVDYSVQPPCAAVGLSNGQVAACMVHAELSGTFGTRSLDGQPHDEQCLAVAVHSASGLVVSGCARPTYPVSYPPFPYDASIKVWQLDMEEEAEMQRPLAEREARPLLLGREGHLVQTLLGHEAGVRKVLILDPTAPSPAYAASASDDHTIRVWQMHEGACAHTLSAHTAPVVGLVLLSAAGAGSASASASASPSSAAGGVGMSSRLISVSADGEVIEWDWRTGECIAKLSSSLTHLVWRTNPRVTTAAFHEPTMIIALGTENVATGEGDGEERDGEGDGVNVHLMVLLRQGQRCEGSNTLSTPELRYLSKLRLDSTPYPLDVDGSVRNEVCALQLDADKLVAVARGSVAGGYPGQGMIYAVKLRSDETLSRSRGRGSDTSPYEIEPHTPLDQSVAIRDVIKGPSAGYRRGGGACNLTCHPLWKRPLRYYVSSVSFHGSLLVHDGADDSVVVESY